jgi:riboflavin kinase / FMN adenylyltransferase
MTLTVLHTPEEWAARCTSAGRRAALSIGFFDGLHLGHQEVLRHVVARAKAAATLGAAEERAEASSAPTYGREVGGAAACIAGVVTFDPHPAAILRPGKVPKLISTLAQRLAGFEAAGIEAALVMKFTPDIAAISAEDFLAKILVERLGMSAICVGPNFRFGHKQAGNTDLLAQMAPRFGYEVEILPPSVLHGQLVSSTAVRTAIAAGQVALAAELLGHPFSLTGPIRPGDKRGGAVLVPTLNLAPEQELLPKTGVYCTETRVVGTLYRSVTNVGFRPTFNGQALSIESHLFDFSEMMPEGEIEVRFWERLRDEQKFASVDELRRQIGLDLAAAQAFFKKRDASSVCT